MGCKSLATIFFSFSLFFYCNYEAEAGSSTIKADLECEFPPRMEEDFTRMRKKRLTTENGLVCLEDYPYTVSVRIHGKHWCGGAIVSKFWVLTAAQCFDYVTKEEVSIRMGSVFRDFGGRLVSAVSIQRHPKYKIDHYYPEHNLAMVKTNVAIAPAIRMQPVALAMSDAEIPPKFGETVVTGFGSVSTGQIREGVNQELRRMIVREVRRDECRLVYGNDYNLQSDHMCLQSVSDGIALCAGDIGDPAVHFSGLNRKGTLFGIALFSGTEECAYKSKPGVYAKQKTMNALILQPDLVLTVLQFTAAVGTCSFLDEVSYSRGWIDKVISEIPEKMESVESGENAILIDA